MWAGNTGARGLSLHVPSVLIGRHLGEGPLRQNPGFPTDVHTGGGEAPDPGLRRGATPWRPGAMASTYHGRKHAAQGLSSGGSREEDGRHKPGLLCKVRQRVCGEDFSGTSPSAPRRALGSMPGRCLSGRSCGSCLPPAFRNVPSVLPPLRFPRKCKTRHETLVPAVPRGAGNTMSFGV